MRKRLLVHAAVLVAVLGASVISFQNCAQQMQPAHPAAFATPEEVEDDLVYALKSVAHPDDVCNNTESYTCESRAYGPDLEDAVLKEKVCVDGGCVEVLSLAFNTERQIAACGDCTSADIRERYDNESLVCMNRHVTVGGSLPLKGEGADVASAVEDAKAKCRGLAGLE